MCGITQLFIVPSFLQQLYNRLFILRSAILLRSGLARPEQSRHPRIVHSSLGQCFRYDGWLLEFNAKPQMDDGVQEAAVHAGQQIICSFVTREHVLRQDVLPSLALDLALEEDEEVVVVLLIAKVGFETLGLVHVVDDRLLERSRRTLIRGVDVVAFLDLIW